MNCIYRLIFLSLLVLFSHSDCIFKDVCDTCTPDVEIHPPFQGEPISCPHIKGDVCCSDKDDAGMISSFQALDATFGAKGGGCDLCGINMKKFWCEYACSPRQTDFIIPHGQVDMENPQKSGEIIRVLNMSLIVYPDTACDLWKSCARTQFASQVSAMQTPAGFLSFQGYQSAGSEHKLIYIEFTNDPTKGIYYAPYSCNTTFTNCTKSETGGEICYDDDGYSYTEPCACNNCEESCSNNQMLFESYGVFEGFDGFLILVVYGIVLALWLGLLIYRRIERNNIEKKLLQKNKDIYDAIDQNQ